MDLDRDARTGQQWLRSIEAYLLWRAGEDWRALHRESERWNPSRWEFLDAARLIRSILHTPRFWVKIHPEADRAAQLELDGARGVPAPPSLEEFELIKKGRGPLVDELMRDPLFTDRRLISRFSRQKLARMVLQSRERISAEMAEPEAKRA